MSAMVGALVLFLVAGKSLANTPAFKKMVLHTTMDSSKGYVSIEEGQLALIGLTGKTTSTLRPSGKVEIDGKVYNASAESGLIDANIEVIVVSQQMNNLVVRKIVT